MKLRTLMAALLSVISLSIQAYIIPPIDAIQYERMIVVAEQNYLNAQEPFDPIDPNHSAMLASGVFTPAEISQLDIDFTNDLYAQYGVDFRTVAPDADGIRRIPGATMKPAAYGTKPGQPSFITYDSVNPEREYKWIQHEYTTIVEFESGFIVPDGFTQKGANVTPGCVFFRGYIVHGKQGKDWSKSKFREVYTINCTQLTAQSPNMWLEEEIAKTYPIFNSDGEEGFGLATITKVHLPPVAAGTSHVEGRTVLTWVKAAE